MAKGGQFENENGLIYAMKYQSQSDVKVVTVGYEYYMSAPQVNFFDFDLTPKKHEETGDLHDRFPAI